MTAIPKRLDRTVIYENEWVSLYADKVLYHDGRILEKHHLVHFDYESSSVVVLNRAGKILLIKSARYATQSEEWEIPAGRVDPGETAEDCARREVLEETGCTIKDLTLLVRENPANGISDKTMAVFRAQLDAEGLPATPEEVLEKRWFSQEGIRAMIRRREIHCGPSLVGLLMVLAGIRP